MRNAAYWPRVSCSKRVFRCSTEVKSFGGTFAMATKFALVHFVKEDTTDIIDVQCIPKECQFQGSICQVKWPKGNPKALPSTVKVLRVSHDMEELSAVEDKVHDEIDKKFENPRKRTRKVNVKYAGTDTASEKEVSHALNEKAKLSIDNKSRKDAAMKRYKAAVHSKKSAQATLDEKILQPAATTFSKTATSAVASSEVIKTPPPLAFSTVTSAPDNCHKLARHWMRQLIADVVPSQ